MDTDENQSEVYRRWDDGFLVRQMKSEEVRQVIKWFESNGDGARSIDVEVAFDMRGDNDGFCIGELNGEMIASVVVTQLADDLKYASYLYIDERYRKMGFAGRMIAVAHDIIDRCNWIGIVGINSLDHAQSMFEKVGYKSAYKAIIYKGTVPADVDQEFGTDIRQVKLLIWAYCHVA